MKEKTIRIEDAFLSPFACKSKDSLGRVKDEPPCPMRTDFQRDRDRIIYCKAFRRLKNKTQVFFSPEGDHYRTRLTHTLTVSQIARSISRALSLNEDLTEAIALGHDLGHTPFGHSGERILNKLNPKGFLHNEQSVRVVTKLENDGKGLNLTREVVDGILNHKKGNIPMTLEGMAVNYADRIAYINHDIDDAISGGFITDKDLPKDAAALLGKTSSERINAMIMAIYRESEGKNSVKMADAEEQATEELRSFLFRKVYNDVTF
ncbi:MAG: deoxyguanosinetriphosphate triphosphohydrolase, partial [Clostridia bacterium]|nr:deoxyguanosinetriphosphate triphosphohydrolase [Clostridia bacterium]